MSDSDDNASDNSAATLSSIEELPVWKPIFPAPTPTRREIPTVVYVHGIAGSDYATWKLDRHEPLPELIKNYLELATDPNEYGYTGRFQYKYDPQDLFNGTGGCKLQLERIALGLLSTIRDDNPSFFDPIVIVAHDIGGVIVKKALLLAREYTWFRTLAIDVDRLVFIGTPHVNDSSRWEELLVDFNVALRDLDLKHFGAATSFQEASIEFSIINSQFINTASEDYGCLTFYQEDPIQGQSDYKILVPKDLTTCGLQHEIRIPRNRSHFQMGWFSLEDEQLKILGEYILDATTRYTMFEDYRLPYFDLMSLITPSRGSMRTLAGIKSSSNSFRWILEDATFQAWENSVQPSILHLQGVPGSGKTSMSQYLNRHLSEQGAPRDAVVATYFCNRNEHSNGTVDDLCCSLTGQILSALPMAYVQMYALHQSRLKDAMYGGEPQRPFISDPRCWFLLRTIFSTSGESKLYCIINAIDQCHGDVTGFLQQMVAFTAIATSKLKIVVTSSTGSTSIQEILSGCFTISLDEREPMQAEAQKGIDAAVRDLISHRPGLRSFQQEILDSICQQRPLNVLDASFKVKYLHAVEMQSTPKSVKSTLTKISSNVTNVALENALDITDMSIRKWAFRVLSWMVYVCRPLQLAELNVALAMLNWSNSPDPADEYLSRDLEADLEYALGPVISIEQKVVRFAHPSVEALVKTYIKDKQDLDDTEVVCHRTIFRICLAYLSPSRRLKTEALISNELTYQSPAGLLDMSEFPDDLGLTFYAARYWPLHFQQRENPRDEDVEHIAQFLENGWDYSYERILRVLSTSLHTYEPPNVIAAALGLGEVIKHQASHPAAPKASWRRGDTRAILNAAARHDHVAILQQHKDDVSSVELWIDSLTTSLEQKSQTSSAFIMAQLKLEDLNVSDLETLLTFATSAGNDQLLRLIGERVREQSTSIAYNTIEVAVRNAASTNRREMLEFLFDLLDITRDESREQIEENQKRIKSIALHDAVLCACESVVEMLIENPQIELYKNETGLSTLHVACILDYPSVVSKFLKHVNVDLKDQEQRTPLHFAAVHGSIHVVQPLLDAGADIEALDSNGETPLFVAISYGQVEVSRLLVSKGAETVKTNQQKESLLHIAISTGLLELVKVVVSSKLDINVTDNKKLTPLSYAIGSFLGYGDIATFLIDEGAKVEPETENSETALHLATKKRMPDLVQKLLDRGANIHARDNLGRTCLHLVAQVGSTPTLLILLKQEVDVNVRDHSDKTPLHYAAEEGNRESVRILLENGALSDVVDSYNQRPLEYAAQGRKYESGCLILKQRPQDPVEEIILQRLFHNAAIAGDYDAVKLVLDASKDARSIVNSKDEFEFADSGIFNAIYGGSLAIVEMVFSKGADVALVVGDQRGPLQRSVFDDRLDLTQLLLDRGIDVNYVDRDQGSALHVVSYDGLLQQGRLLLSKDKAKAKANVELFDKELFTPLQRALWHPDVTQLLLDAGAKVCVDGQNMNALNHTLKHYEEEGSTAVMKLYFEHGAKVEDADIRGMTAMHWVAWLGNLQLANRFLADDPLALERKDVQGRTALHFAALADRSEMVTFILDKLNLQTLKEVDLADIDGWTPLHWSCKSFAYTTWRVLVDRGIDLSAVTKAGWTAESVATYHGLWESYNNAVLYDPSSRRSSPVFDAGDLKQNEVPLYQDDVWREATQLAEQHDTNDKLIPETSVEKTSSTAWQGRAEVNGVSTRVTSDQGDTDGEKKSIDGDNNSRVDIEVSNDRDVRVPPSTMDATSTEFLRDPGRLSVDVAMEKPESAAASDNDAADDEATMEHGSNQNASRPASPLLFVNAIDEKTLHPCDAATRRAERCAHCLNIIRGPVWECDTCATYYLCFKCSAHSQVQHPWHIFHFKYTPDDNEFIPFPSRPAVKFSEMETSAQSVTGNDPSNAKDADPKEVNGSNDAKDLQVVDDTPTQEADSGGAIRNDDGHSEQDDEGPDESDDESDA